MIFSSNLTSNHTSYNQFFNNMSIINYYFFNKINNFSLKDLTHTLMTNIEQMKFSNFFVFRSKKEDSE